LLKKYLAKGWNIIPNQDGTLADPEATSGNIRLRFEEFNDMAIKRAIITLELRPTISNEIQQAIAGGDGRLGELVRLLSATFRIRLQVVFGHALLLSYSLHRRTVPLRWNLVNEFVFALLLWVPLG